MALEDFTKRDKQAILTRMLATARTVYPTWTNSDYASAGNAMLHSMAAELAGCHYAQDLARRQSRLSTTTNRDVALTHASSLGYPVKANSASQATLVVVLGAPLSDDLVVAPGDVSFSTTDDTPLVFEVRETITVPSGSSQFQIRVENAAMVTETFSVPESLPDQPFRLAFGPYVQDSIVVVANGTPFTPVNTLALSAENATDVRIDLTAQDRLRLKFGAGPNGAQVPAGAVIATYKVGGGAVGTTEVDTIQSPSVQTLTANDGSTASIVSVTNPERSFGGDNADSLEDIQRKAPRSRGVASDRSIAELDYVDHAESIPGVLRAYAVTHKATGSLSPNKTELLIIPDGGGTAPQDLIDLVQNRMETVFTPSILTNLTVRASPTLLVNISATLVLVQNVEESAARDSIVAELEKYFDPDENGSVKFGAELINAGQDPVVSYHRLLCLVLDDAHVFSIEGSERQFLVNDAHADVVISAVQFPILGTVTLINSETGLVI